MQPRNHRGYGFNSSNQGRSLSSSIRARMMDTRRPRSAVVGAGWVGGPSPALIHCTLLTCLPVLPATLNSKQPVRHVLKISPTADANATGGQSQGTVRALPVWHTGRPCLEVGGNPGGVGGLVWALSRLTHMAVCCWSRGDRFQSLPNPRVLVSGQAIISLDSVYPTSSTFCRCCTSPPPRSTRHTILDP